MFLNEEYKKMMPSQEESCPSIHEEDSHPQGKMGKDGSKSSQDEEDETQTVLDSPKEEEEEEDDPQKTSQDDEQPSPSTPPKKKLKSKQIKKKTTRSPHLPSQSPPPVWMTPASRKKNPPRDKKTTSPPTAANKKSGSDQSPTKAVKRAQPSISPAWHMTQQSGRHRRLQPMPGRHHHQEQHPLTIKDLPKPQHRMSGRTPRKLHQ